MVDKQSQNKKLFKATYDLGALHAIQKCSFFSRIDTNELKILASSAKTYSYRRGEFIRRSGELVTSFYIVVEGMVKLFMTSHSGDELILDVRRNNEYFGQNLGYDPVLMLTAVVALTDTTILSISSKSLKSFMTRNPNIMNKFIESHQRRMYYLLERLFSLAKDTSKLRLYKVLYQILLKHGDTLYLTHQELADMTAVTLETTTRNLTQLKDSGIIKLSRGAITIINRPKLISLLSELPPSI